MSICTLRPRTTICHLCDSMISRQSLSRQPFRTQKPLTTIRTSFPNSRRAYSQNAQPAKSQHEVATKKEPTRVLDAARQTAVDAATTKIDLERTFEGVRRTISSFMSREDIPTEQETIRALKQCSTLANYLQEPTSPSPGKKDRAASALLSLDDSKSKKSPPLDTRSMQAELSKLVYSIISHPLVFISPEVLASYIRIQASLKRPETFPEAFSLYANKPVPEEGSSPVKFSNPNPNKVANAIPKPVADLALQTAIEAKQLVVAMDIVEFSYSTKAFRRAKFVRRGLLPATGVAVAPIAAYTLASQLAVLQTTMETGMATNVAFAGMLAYVGFTGTIGVVAVTTANDQMDRVTWTPGMPLRQRWIREEERAAIDKIAGAWGFREIWRRGEEEGEEWDALREWIGMKGMILDRTELMEGME
ncbi:hypothetical protein LSUE1_G003067 [Lachnellula suecica]|uniref:Uncharacterized protein n=1 Tax=Lachnellula suecica TaxID=602035 RepID=A0A8T9C2T2_9HELO|nr:hypothetical protein LSUE1_G003067 [Lachnellula suecica]